MKNLSELKLKEKKYIIFDMDGTLIDSIGVWNRVDQKVIQEYAGLTIDLDVIQKERDEFFHQNQVGDIYLAYCRFLIEKYNLDVQTDSELQQIRLIKSGEVFENEMDYKPYAVDLLKKFKELGFTIILATTSTQTELDIYSRKNKKMISQMNIVDDFDLVLKKEDVKNIKPNPEVYNKILGFYNATPDECLAFEDSYVGVLASKDAGIEVVNVYDRYADKDRERINEIADYSIKDYTEFLKLIENPNKKYKKVI